MTYTLTIPPSANNLFATVRGRRVKSRRYAEWLAENRVGLLTQRARPVPQPARVVIRIKGGAGFNRQRDGDNAIKPCLDLLCAAGVLMADTAVMLPDIRVVYREDRSRGAVATCVVELETLEGTEVAQT